MAYVDQFVLTATSSAGTTQARTGYGFQPSAFVIVAAGTNPAGFYHMCIGFAVSTSDRCYTRYVVEDGYSNPSPQYAAVANGTDAVASVGTPKWDIDSFDSDGLTFIVDVNSINSVVTATVIAFSPEEVRSADILSWTVPASTGSSNVTGSTVVLPNTAIHVGRYTRGICIGASAGPASSISNALSVMYLIAPGAASASVNYSNSTECIAEATTTGVADRVRVTDWISTGFTINTDEAGGGVSVYSLVMDASFSAVGSLTTLTSTGVDIDVDASALAKIRAVLFASNCEAEDVVDTAEGTVSSELSIGGCDQDLNQGSGAFRGRDAVDPTEVYTESGSTVYTNINASSDILVGEMSVTAIDRATFTCQMTDADPSENFVWYLIIGISTAPRSAPIMF